MDRHGLLYVLAPSARNQVTRVIIPAVFDEAPCVSAQRRYCAVMWHPPDIKERGPGQDRCQVYCIYLAVDPKVL